MKGSGRKTHSIVLRKVLDPDLTIGPGVGIYEEELCYNQDSRIRIVPNKDREEKTFGRRGKEND